MSNRQQSYFDEDDPVEVQEEWLTELERLEKHQKATARVQNGMQQQPKYVSKDEVFAPEGERNFKLENSEPSGSPSRVSFAPQAPEGAVTYPQPTKSPAQTMSINRDPASRELKKLQTAMVPSALQPARAPVISPSSNRRSARVRSQNVQLNIGETKAKAYKAKWTNVLAYFSLALTAVISPEVAMMAKGVRGNPSIKKKGNDPDFPM